jgi:hypothetical protein
VEIWHGALGASALSAGILREVAAPEASLVQRRDLHGKQSPESCFASLAEVPHSVAVVSDELFLRHLFARITGMDDPDSWETVNGAVTCITANDYYCGLGVMRRRWSLFWMISPRILGASVPD